MLRIALVLFSLFIPISASAQTVALTPAVVLNAKGDGPDGKGNTADDTWQFWFELAHAKGVMAPLRLHTTTMTESQRKNGIPRKVRGPIGKFLPHPNDSEGWITAIGMVVLKVFGPIPKTKPSSSRHTWKRMPTAA